MRRFIAGAALGLLATASLVPLASAHSVHDVSWEGRDNQSPLEEGSEVWGTDFLDLRMENDGQTSWMIEMVHEASGTRSFCQGDVPQADKFKDDPVFRCNWDTLHIGDMTQLQPGQHLSGVPASPNGVYQITGHVWAVHCFLACGGSEVPEEHHTSFKVTVTNQLSKPTGVSHSFNSETRTIRVAWNPNPEPDIARYVVQERFNGGAWVDHDRGLNTSFEKAGDPGSYQFQVVAHRPHSVGVASDPTPAFEVSAAPAPSPEGPGPDLGPEPGVTIPTNAPTTGTTAKTSSKAKPKTTETPRGGLSGSTLFSRPSSPTTQKTTVTTIDDGFQEAISYPTSPPVAVEMPGEPVAVPRLITEKAPFEPRALLVPLAAGLALFIFAMQMTVMVRRRPSIATSEDDWA